MKRFISINLLLLSIAGSAQTSLKIQTDNYSNLNQYLWSFSKNKALPNQKSLIDFNTIENWRSLGYYLAVSGNAEYFAYTINKPTGTRFWFRRPDSLIIQATKTNWRQAFAVSTQGFFSADGKKYIFQNGSTLSFLQLGSKQTKEVKDVSYYKANSKNNWLAYQVTGKDSLILYNLATGKEKLFDNVTEFDFDNSGDWLVCKNNTKQLLLYSLATGAEKRFPDAVNYALAADGKTLVVKTNANLQYISLPQGEAKIIWTIKEKTTIGNYSLDAFGKQVLFTIIDSSDEANNTIGYYEPGIDKPVVKITNGTDGIPNRLMIADASFTDNGQYINLVLRSKPDVAGKPDENRAAVEVWNHKDSYLQSVQSKKLAEAPAYNAIVNKENIKLVFLESDDKKIFLLHGDYALEKKDYTTKYGDRFWENGKDSCWLVSLKDGSSRFLPTKTNSFWFSPAGNYLVYFDAAKGGHYYSYDLHNNEISDITKNVPEYQLCLTNKEADDEKPDDGNLAAWIENDKGLLVYDDHDIWTLDLTGKLPAVNLTKGFGRANSIMFNLFITDKYSFSISHPNDIPVVKIKESMLLSGFNDHNKENGFYRQNVAHVGEPELVYMGGYFMSKGRRHDVNLSVDGMIPVKAKNTNAWIVQRQSSSDAPNYYETKDFKNFRRLTNYQPQQGYQWFTEELVSFKHLDGKMGQGILYKPENFDPTKKYPVLISFYGQFSNNMYQFPNPSYIDQAMATGKSPIWFLNNGYLVFTPDIIVAPLRYGPKAFSVIEGAAQYLKTLPYVDANKLGCGGSHSWSAKLGAYVFTHSKSFAATAITEGYIYADAINVYLSAEGGRMDGVETGQQYGNLWENKDRWLDQTTVLNVDKASSPLLLLCNKESIPDYQDQTFQFFNALRRLDKNVWWLKYDEGDHTLHDLKELQDYTIRYTQFFDHYLKYAPAPQWMTEGIPLKLKGIESRYELDPQGTCNSTNGEPCPICQAWNAQYKRTPEMFKKEIKDWVLDKDIAEELERKINERRKVLDKEGDVQTREVMRMLNK
ncbi:MAG: hypothetical protein ABI675_14450 [Chitinophagaceae bacterium]